MDVNSEHVEISERIDNEQITDIELEVKIEKLDEKTYIKTEVLEEKNNSDSFKIICGKRKNQEKSNLENETKKKEEYGLFEDLDYQEEPQEIQEIDIDDLDNQVSEISLH